MDALVSLHGLIRWLVLLAGLVALVVAVLGWLGQGVSEKTARQGMLLYALTLDVQVLLGIVIWLLEQRWAGGERFFRFEHPLIMLIALAVVHIAAARARRASGPLAAARTRAVGVVLSLVLVLLGIPWGR